MPSFQPIDLRDLNRLARLTKAEREDLFERHPDWAQRYGNGQLFTILTGASATHFSNAMSGFTSFELCSFHAEADGRDFPPMGRGCRDFGPSRHGREADAPETFQGRQVWLDQRPLAPVPELSALELLQQYIASGRTPTARRLRAGSAVFVEPEPMLGLLAWPALAINAPRPRNVPD